MQQPTLSVAPANLIEAARKARQHAYAPYSGFAVGAALLVHTDGGQPRLIDGCNVENASYGATRCAEQTAVLAAVSAGHRRFEAIAIVADADEFTAPCGVCRQILSEFSPDMWVLMGRLDGRYEAVRLSDLLPRRFDAGFLTDEKDV